MSKKYLPLLFSICVSAQSYAAESVTDESYETWSWYGSGGIYKIKEDAAARADVGVDERVVYINMGLEGQKNNFIYGGGLSLLIYDDQNEFSQWTTDRDGDDLSESDSDASGWGLFGEAGYAYPVTPNRSVQADLIGGFEAAWSERSIPSCEDCYSEDIELELGLYVMPRFRYTGESGWFVSTGLKYFLGDDMSNGLLISIGKTFHR